MFCNVTEIWKANDLHFEKSNLRLSKLNLTNGGTAMAEDFEFNLVFSFIQGAHKTIVQ
jgi:hypothetical protein